MWVSDFYCIFKFLLLICILILSDSLLYVNCCFFPGKMFIIIRFFYKILWISVLVDKNIECLCKKIVFLSWMEIIFCMKNLNNRISLNEKRKYYWEEKKRSKIFTLLYWLTIVTYLFGRYWNVEEKYVFLWLNNIICLFWGEILKAFFLIYKNMSLLNVINFTSELVLI